MKREKLRAPPHRDIQSCLADQYQYIIYFLADSINGSPKALYTVTGFCLLCHCPNIFKNSLHVGQLCIYNFVSEIPQNIAHVVHCLLFLSKTALIQHLYLYIYIGIYICIYISNIYIYIYIQVSDKNWLTFY